MSRASRRTVLVRLAVAVFTLAAVLPARARADDSPSSRIGPGQDREDPPPHAPAPFEPARRGLFMRGQLGFGMMAMLRDADARPGYSFHAGVSGGRTFGEHLDLYAELTFRGGPQVPFLVSEGAVVVGAALGLRLVLPRGFYLSGAGGPAYVWLDCACGLQVGTTALGTSFGLGLEGPFDNRRGGAELLIHTQWGGAHEVRAISVEGVAFIRFGQH